MKLLIINNLTRRLPKLLTTLSKHNLSVIDFDALTEDFDETIYDGIILTGGSGYSVYKYAKTRYKKGRDLILQTTTPTFGIWLWMQLICHAYEE